ncbi:hypothetical protein PLICRDRAFT_177986 [Plicaturopsis crispa FD-325 SS-3]|nr:hypothetical protein PLICRDRAFT_177986 [Plicaturopsis crispa FD-325 SS-3]
MASTKSHDRKASPVDDAGFHRDSDVESKTEESYDPFLVLVEQEKGRDIKLRTMTWQKAAILLLGDQVCLAVMGQAWSYSLLGWVPGLLTTFITGALTWIGSYTIWAYMMKHPEVRDFCDIGYLVFGRSKIAYEVTAFALLCNNIMLIGFHVFTGAKILNTLSDHGACTVWFSFVTAIIGILANIPRELKHVSYMSIGSAICMFIGILLQLIFVAIESNPATGTSSVYPADGLVTTHAFSPPGTGFINSLNAVLNITFVWAAQILFPSFIAEMEHPKDFPKALAVLSVTELVLFSVPAIIGYRYAGQYTQAPAFGSLQPLYKKLSFAWVIVPTVVIGVIYGNVTAKHIYGRIMKDSRHAHSHTVIGWGVWIAVVVGIWAVAFVFGEVIPSMGDFLSLLGSLFDSWFGFLFEAMAYFHLRRGRYFKGFVASLLTLIHIFIAVVGLFLLGPGMYTSVSAIKSDYAGSVKPAFSCADNSL